MNPEMTKKLRAPIPGELIKQLNGNDYISGQTAIDRLIQATGDDGWSFHIVETKAYTDNTGKVVHVAMQGQLTIEHQSRQAWGEAKSTNNAKEELFKNAETDTLKRCARLFGVALELYGDLLDEETGEITHRATARAQPRQQRDNRRYAHVAPDAPQNAPQAATDDQGTPKDYGHATQKQVGFIAKLMRELEWSREDAERYLDATYGVKRVSDLGSNQDVSKFIDHLLKVKADNEPSPVGAEA